MGTGDRAQTAGPHGYQPRTVQPVTGCLKILAVTEPLPFRRESPTASA